MEAMKEVPVADLMTIYAPDISEGKYCVVFDKKGVCAQFFGYQANLLDFDRDILKVQTESQTVDEALEKVRKGMIWTMRGSKRAFCINCDKLNPDWKNKFTAADDLFPTSTVFDRKTFMNEEVYRKIIKEDEDTNPAGGEGLVMVQDFNITLVYKYPEDGNTQAILDNIPHSEDFATFIIN
jgi:hypothetical protein